MMRIEYKMAGGLKEVLHVVYELRAVTGMEPEAVIMDDGTKVRFSYSDYRFLISEDIDEKQYIERNVIK